MYNQKTMALTLREEKGGRITTSEMDENFRFLYTSSLGATNISYPNTSSFTTDIPLYSTASLSTSDILGLNWNSGFEVLPTLPNDYYYDVVKTIYEFNFSKSAFSVSSSGLYIGLWQGNMALNYVGEEFLVAPIQNSYIVAPTIADQTSNANEVPYYIGYNNTGGTNVSLYYGFSGYTNGQLAEGGNSTLKLKVYYYIRQFG